MENEVKKAEILIEALPYIKTFASKTFVIKYGGAAMIDDGLKTDLIHNLILLKFIGINPVLVHGGGPEITAYLEQLNIKTKFVNGLRVTDEDTMNVVQMTLVGKINQEIVSLINVHGGKGVGLSGKDANLIISRKKENEIKYNPDTNEQEEIDLGYVGDVEKINPDLVISLCKDGYIPVISPIGIGINGDSFNINADEVAGHLAVALQAEKLIMLTDTDGIYEDPSNDHTKINSLTINMAKQMIANKQIVGGMIPKVKACIEAISNGVKRTHIIDGRQRHSLLIELFTDKGIGTMVTGN